MRGQTILVRRGCPSLMLAVICALVGSGSGISSDVVRIPTKAKGAGPLFQIVRGVEWGYINRKGRVVIRPQFQNEGDFFEGLARVQVSGNWGFIDERGHYPMRESVQTVAGYKTGSSP